eukprot:gene25283-biopygen19487
MDGGAAAAAAAGAGGQPAPAAPGGPGQPAAAVAGHGYGGRGGLRRLRARSAARVQWVLIRRPSRRRSPRGAGGRGRLNKHPLGHATPSRPHLWGARTCCFRAWGIRPQCGRNLSGRPAPCGRPARSPGGNPAPWCKVVIATATRPAGLRPAEAQARASGSAKCSRQHGRLGSGQHGRLGSGQNGHPPGPREVVVSMDAGFPPSPRKCWSAAPQLTPGGVRCGAKSAPTQALNLGNVHRYGLTTILFVDPPERRNPPWQRKRSFQRRRPPSAIATTQTQFSAPGKIQ